jgi:ribulose-5-phosphate 4-epimerase/fuculose-1-phosphate aldolase
MIDEGYIKFELYWEQKANDFKFDISKLMHWRDHMHKLHLIGNYPDLGIGFGNISQKLGSTGAFVISGTQTGDVFPIKEEHFTTVTKYDLEANSVWCKGPIKASSESMTHAAIYEYNNAIRAVIHVHHLNLWKELLNKVPTSQKNVPYGTPEMAMEIHRLFKEEQLSKKQIMAMAGHDEGIITFGETLEEAAEVLMKYYNSI